MNSKSHSPLGRSAEFETLRGALRRALDGSGATLVLEGEAGIGKSSLLETLIAQARSDGLFVYAGATDEYEVGRPFGTVIDAFTDRRKDAEPEVAELAELLLRGPTSAGEANLESLRFQVVDAVLDSVERLTHRQGVVVVFDDLHWADDATLLTLGSLARRIRTLPVLMLWATRPYNPSGALAAQINRVVADGQHRLSLGPLSDESVEAIAERTLGARPDQQLVEQVARAGGNPFFLTQLLTAMLEEGQIEIGNDGLAAYEGQTMPQRLLDTVGLRVGRLSIEAQRVLRVASVIGPSIRGAPARASPGPGALHARGAARGAPVGRDDQRQRVHDRIPARLDS